MAARFIPKQTVSNRMYEYYDLSSSQRRSGQLATRHVERCDAGRDRGMYAFGQGTIQGALRGGLLPFYLGTFGGQN
jgi:hypothetical protein